ncbi:MAG TPA: hypothetical protein VMV69_20220 [Pirellulales bacterium]|nr:hypothetical protein [Pirellulales bacterium]
MTIGWMNWIKRCSLTALLWTLTWGASGLAFPLDSWYIADGASIRGGANCDASLSTFNCVNSQCDASISQATCTGGCNYCDGDASTEQCYNMLEYPWTAENCSGGTSIAGGCGNQYVSGTCTWNANLMACFCNAQQTNMPCDLPQWNYDTNCTTVSGPP